MRDKKALGVGGCGVPRAQEVDEEEDRRYGRDKRGDELPEELASGRAG